MLYHWTMVTHWSAIRRNRHRQVPTQAAAAAVAVADTNHLRHPRRIIRAVVPLTTKVPVAALLIIRVAAAATILPVVTKNHLLTMIINNS